MSEDLFDVILPPARHNLGNNLGLNWWNCGFHDLNQINYFSSPWIYTHSINQTKPLRLKAGTYYLFLIAGDEKVEGLVTGVAIKTKLFRLQEIIIAF